MRIDIETQCRLRRADDRTNNWNAQPVTFRRGNLWILWDYGDAPDAEELGGLYYELRRVPANEDPYIQT